MDNTSTVLQRAFQHIKAGEKQAALDILTPLIRAEPGNAEAWYLLGLALSDPEKRIYAFEQVLRLDPNNQPAQRQLDKLRNGPVAEPPARGAESVTRAQSQPQPRTLPVAWILTGAGLLLLILLTIGGLLLFRSSLAASQPTATLVATTFKGTATSRPSVTPYPHRATGTPIPAAVTPTDTVVSAPRVDMFNEKGMPVNGQISAVTEMKSGHLEADATVSFDLDVDSENEISFIVKWTGAQPLVFTLNSPSGQLIDEAYAVSHPQDVSFERAETMIYRITTPSIGVWTINLRATDAGDYGAIGRFTKNPLTLSVESYGSILSGTDMVDLRAKLLNYDERVAGASAVAAIQYPDGTFSTVRMTSNFPGEYRIEYKISENQMGVVSVHITMAGDYNGIKFTRSNVFSIPVWDHNVLTLTGEYTDKIGKYQGFKAINIEMGIDSTQACTCSVFALLKAGDKTMGTASDDNIVLVVGHNRITLHFITIGALGEIPPYLQLDGPYTLTDLSFQPGRASPVSLYAQDVWKTAAYRWQELKP